MSDMESSNQKIVESVVIDDNEMDAVIDKIVESVEIVNNNISEQDVPPNMSNSLYLSETSTSSENDFKDDMIDKIIDEIHTDFTNDENDENEENEYDKDDEENEDDKDDEENEDDKDDESESEDVPSTNEDEDDDESESEDTTNPCIQILVVKEHSDKIPWHITYVASVLIFVYVLKIIFMICELNGCNCPRNCICLS